jgi:glycerol-3-phosphate dehydrogenase
LNNISSELSAEGRERIISKCKSTNELYDLLIIGGGINGAGVARDAASRGLKVILVEQKDFAEGTSSRSSKLVHGGIRYLENLEFGLVFEALRERGRLFEIAPHLVHPLRFFLPIYKGDKYGMFILGMGMWLYDTLALFDTPEMHQRYNSKDTMQRLKILNSDGLVGSYSYFDAYMDDDRLVLETLRSANTYGAKAVSYCSAEAATMEGGVVSAVTCRDLLTNSSFQIRAKHVVSTVGPWTDEVAKSLLNVWTPIMRPSKGIHLTLRRDRLPIDDVVVMTSADQKRIVFAIPRNEMIVVGTTDTDYKGDLNSVFSTREDVDYLLAMLREYFPNAKITEQDVIASYAGVRPLVRDSSGSAGKTSREHTIFTDPRGITFVAGGKYTTYRAMAEETVDVAIQNFAIEERVKFGRTQTLLPLNKLATNESKIHCDLKKQKWASYFQVSIKLIERMIDRHLEETEAILNKYAFQIADLPDDQAFLVLEANHAIDETMCFNLKDFYLRRVPVFLAWPDHGFDSMEQVIQVFVTRFGWSQEEVKKQKSALMSHMENELGWRRIIS